MAKNQIKIYLKWVSFLSLVNCSKDRFVDSEAHGGSDQGQGEVANDTEDDPLSLISKFLMKLYLIREMYLTAKRHTRTDPHAIPESLGLSQ